MAKRGNDAPKYTKLTAADMRDALPKLRRRLEELKKLDVSHLEARGDPKFEVIETRANHALAEVFGPDSIQYNDYHVTLDTAGWEAGGTPKDEVLAGYQEGSDRAIANFETAIAHFEEELQERRGLEEPDSAARILRCTPAHAARLSGKAGY